MRKPNGHADNGLQVGDGSGKGLAATEGFSAALKSGRWSEVQRWRRSDQRTGSIGEKSEGMLSS